MNCGLRDREENIRKYLDGKLSESEMTAFEEHFLNCNDCLEELRNSVQLSEFIQNEGEGLFPEFQVTEKFEEKEVTGSEKNSLLDYLSFIFTPRRISFGIVTAVLIFFVFKVFESDDDLVTDDIITYNENDVANVSDSTDEIVSVDDNAAEDSLQELYAANFEESENLEFLMGQNYRSGDDLIVISPSEGDKIQEEVKFHWNYNSEVQLVLLILNNKEDLLFKFNVKADELKFNADDNGLDPGLYYWKLESEDDLLHIGKFVYGVK